MDLHFQEKCTVFGTMGVVLRMSTIFGLAPLKFKRVGEGWRIRVSTATSLYGKMTVYLICLITMSSLIVDFKAGSLQSFNFKTSSDAAASMGIINVILISLFSAAYSGICRMQCVITSLAQLQKVNIELCHYGPLTPFMTQISHISVCSFIGANLIVIAKFSLTLYYLMLMMKGVLAHILSIAFDLALIMNKLLILQMILLIAAVPASLHHLNECLKLLLQQIRNEHTIHRTPKMIATAVNRFRTLYSCLCCVIKHIDDSHGRVLASLIPIFLTSLVNAFYNLIENVYGNGGGEMNIIDILIYTIYITIHMTNLFMIIEPCHQTFEQMDHTKHVISQLLLLTPPEHHEVIHELELFYKQLIKEVVYYPMSIFYFDRTVIVTVLGSITTYLVIMVGF